MQSSVQQQPSTKAGSPTTTVTPTTNTPTVTPTANMPTVTPVQTGPLATAAMQRGGLIDATRLMITRHHKTMQQAFLAMDKDRNGRIDRDEIRTALTNWNMPPAPHEVDAIFSACDLNGDGSIDWQEFVEAFREALQKSPFRQEEV